MSGPGLGRVAVFDRGASARRALRAVRELVRDGRAAASVAVLSARDRAARFARDADAVVDLAGGLAGALRAARAGAAWLGSAPLSGRAALAEACEAAGAVFVGPSGATLRRLSAPGAIEALAGELGVTVGDERTAGGVLLEVVVVRDARGGARALGPADVSVRLAGTAALVECPAPSLSIAEADAARALALRAAAAAAWGGVCTVRLAFEAGTRRLGLLSLDAAGEAAAAVETASGVDLVRLGLAIAAGRSVDTLAPSQDHAAAARILAREPVPGARAPGRVEVLRLPSDPALVAEADAEEGEEAPSLLATVTARGGTRSEALARLAEGLADADVLLRGSASSKPWVQALCAHPAVLSGAAGPDLAAALADLAALIVPRPGSALLATALEAYQAELDLERARFLAEARRGRPRVGPSAGRSEELRYAGARHRIGVRQIAPDTFRVSADGGKPVDVKVERVGPHHRRLDWQGRREHVLVAADGPDHLVVVDGVPHLVRRDPAGMVTSPMPAVVVAIPVSPGQRVAAGEPIARIESMKVEVVVTAPSAGTVREVLAIANAQVDAGAPLVRLDPLGEEAPSDAPRSSIWLGGQEAPEPAGESERYLAALDELGRLVLGFDVAPGEVRAVASNLRELAPRIAADDRAVLSAEEALLGAFADVHGLFSRARRASTEGQPTPKPPLEELWRYLHDPEEGGAGLSASFVAALRNALSHYGLSLDEPGAALELALLRLQRSHERAAEQGAPVAGLLERRIAAGLQPLGLDVPGARAVLDTLAALGREGFPSLGDLAREVRYRRFDRPAFERVRDDAYARVQEDLDRLGLVDDAGLAPVIQRIVECPQRLASILVAWAIRAGPKVRHRAVETLLRRYYRFRPLENAEALPGEVPAARADYELNGRRTRVLAAHASLADAPAALRHLATLAARAPADRDLALEAYLWAEGPALAEDELAGAIKAGLEQAGFSRPIRRVAVLVAAPAIGKGVPSQRHLTFEGGPGGFVEDRRYRGVHPMLFKRLQLARLEKFDLERLPSVEDVYLYRGVARANPKDERLFAMAEIRDLTPVRDPEGHVVQLPHLEHMLHEALAGMRRFQARRPAHQRLEWNRVILTVAPPIDLTGEEMRGLVERLAPAAEGVGLEMVLIDARLRHPATGQLRETLVRVIVNEDTGISIRLDAPTDRPLEPLAEYQQRVVQLRRRGLTYPYELVKMLAPAPGAQSEMPPGEFVEHELDETGGLVPVARPPGENPSNVVVGVVRSFTGRHPEGMSRVVLLGDPSRAMGSLAEAECRRIIGALDLAERQKVPLEWFAVSAGAKISMESGTENMDWISRVLRKIIEFTQGGGEINVMVCGINVGAQPYWNAEATMLMHTRGILVMVPGSAMVLTGKEALEYSGSVSAEDNQGIGGYDRIMGPNGQAQYRAESLPDALSILMRHYDHCYVVPGERFPRRAPSADPATRDVRASSHGPAGGAGFELVGEVFSGEKNPDRKKPFDIRRIMNASVDQDHEPLERWRDLRGGETAVIWDAHLGGWPVCLVGIESRPLPRLEFVPADGPEFWSAGTLFPQSSKKIARALNAASGNRPAVVLANLSGFDGSPESMRRLQLEYGAEIGRAVVNFDGPIVFCVVSRYHGGAFVVFSKTLREDIEVAAVEGARASVIGGAPAAAVVFAREVDTRTRADPRVQEAEKAALAGGAARMRLAEVVANVRSEKLGELGEEFDRIHSVERALQMGSLDRIIAAKDLRPYLIDAVGRGIERELARRGRGR